MNRKQFSIELSLTLLPLLAALMLEAQIRFSFLEQQNAVLFISILLQLMLENVPLFVAHYLVFKGTNRKAIVWSLGFITYPTITFVIQSKSEAFNAWSLFTAENYSFFLIASAGFGMHKAYSERSSFASYPLISKLLSLNVVVGILALGWALLMAIIFASVDEPMLNQPIPLVIDDSELFSRPLEFLSYFLQFSIIGLLVSSTYAINRYLLIRHILSIQGVFGFVAGCIVTMFIVTPLFSQLALWLPLNYMVQDTLLPSGDRNIFSTDNYVFCFVLLFISTPIILAFERQKQDKAVIEIAQQQTHTELQLLQQQVNPHFLFNTLNNLYALTLKQSSKAPDMVMQLSKLLRYTIYEGQKERVLLSEEIAYIQNYLTLQTIRLTDDCKVETGFPELYEEVKIAPLLLIILIENAFKHGAEKSQTCQMNIDISIDKHKLTMICSNTLSQESDEKKAPGLGLVNLKRRLELLYPNEHQLDIEHRDEVYTATLVLDLSA